jgi:GAF domain-containing protein
MVVPVSRVETRLQPHRRTAAIRCRELTLMLMVATDVSTTIVGRRGPYTAAFTGDIALDLDQKQYEQQDGPGLQAATEQTTVLVHDTAVDTRWNGWPARSGAGSVLSIGLPILDDVGGALNLYGRSSEAFDRDAVRAAQTFAGHAAVTLVNAHLYDRTAGFAQHMQSAMESRAVIEQAKGIIMGERRCTPEDAFGVLTTMSQHANRKLRDVAATIVARSQPAPQPSRRSAIRPATSRGGDAG